MSKAGLDDLFTRYPTLQAENLTLREATRADAPALFDIFSDPQVLEFYDLEPFEHQHQAVEMVARWGERFDRREAVRWGIERTGQSGLIGTIGIHIQSEWRAGLGYDLVPTHWRKGIMTRALGAVIGFAFEQVELERLEALVLPGNLASEKLLGKLGFTREGLLRRYAFFKGDHQDLQCFSLLRDESSH